MARIIPASGDQPCRILLCGERPGIEEYQRDENFVGPAGDELWDRLQRLAGISRDDCRVINLVPTFSVKPPSKAEITEHAWRVRLELQRTKPEIIITVGYHAARFFLPQFEGVHGDYFHGLPFEFSYGRLVPRVAMVVPLVHSSAALRQPGRYQTQLSDDVTALAAIVRTASQTPHRVQGYVPYRHGLASYGRIRQRVGIDTEFDSRTGTVQAVTLSNGGNDAALIEIADNGGAVQSGGGSQQQPTKFLAASIRPARLIAHAATAEYVSLYRLGIDLLDTPIDDTMIMAYVLGRPHLGLKALAWRELHRSMLSYTDVVGPVDDENCKALLDTVRSLLVPVAAAPPKIKGKKAAPLSDETKSARRAIKSIDNIFAKPNEEKSLRQRWNDSVWWDRYPLPVEATWKDAPPAIREPYAMSDAIACRQLGDHLWPEVVEKGLVRGYNLQRDVLPFLVRSEIVGMACDGDQLTALDGQFAREFAENQVNIDALAERHINPLSGDQVSDCLFNELGIRPTRLTKSKKAFTTADKYLKARRKEHEIIPLILDSRQLNKYRGTYTKKLPGMLRDGRYHPDWRICSTATSRLAETVILLIPKHSKRATLIRDCFYATGGHRLIAIDLSQIELRVMAHVSQDAKMLRVFERGDDMHADTAHSLLGAPKGKENQDDSLHRLPAKTMNFGIINGMTEYGMLDQLHEAGQLQWDLDQVREFREAWFRNYSGVESFWLAQIAHGKRHGYVTSLFDRRRYLPGLKSTSEQVRRESERQALFSIQSSADDISKLWDIRIWKKVIRPRQRAGVYCEPWVREHDCTTLEVDRSAARDVANEMLKLVPNLLDIPTTADAKIGRRWGSLEKLK